MNTSPARPLMGNADLLPMRGGNYPASPLPGLFFQPAHDPLGQCADVFQRGSPPAAGEAGPGFLRLPVPLPFLEVDDVLHVGSLVSLARNCETKGQSFHETGKIFHGRNR
jgi:hypothetical protein